MKVQRTEIYDDHRNLNQFKDREKNTQQIISIPIHHKTKKADDLIKNISFFLMEVVQVLLIARFVDCTGSKIYNCTRPKQYNIRD